MENIFSVVGRVVYFASADVQRVISNGWPLLDVSAQIEICGDIFLYCNDQDLNVEIALGCISLDPTEKAIFLNYMLVHEISKISCILNCSERTVFLDYYYELAS